MREIIVFTLLCLGITVSAQVQQEWVARYNGPDNNYDVPYSIAVDPSGNIYVAGNCCGTGPGSDYITIKYNTSGVQLWTQRYNGPGNNYDQITSIAVDDSGNVYVTGYSRGNATGDDYATIKYNSSGEQQWAQRFNGAGNGSDRASVILVDNFGNCIVTGFSNSGSTFTDYATVKYNINGIQQWVSSFNGAASRADYAYAMAMDQFGNIYVTGQSSDTDTSNNITTVKYNNLGIQQWAVDFNGPGEIYDEIANAITVDELGSCYVTGSSFIPVSKGDIITIKYNTTGAQQWTARYNGVGNDFDEAVNIALDNSLNVIVSGCVTGNNMQLDYATIKYNSTGSQEWVRTYNGQANSNDAIISMGLDLTGNIYVTGRSIGTISNNFDFTTIKYKYSGLQMWIQSYNGPGNGSDWPSSIDVDINNNIYVTGFSLNSTQDYDIATVKYSQTIGINPISTEIPASYSLLQNYPNPFNPVTKIRFDLPSNVKHEMPDVKLIILDILGKEVSTLVNEQLKPGAYEVEWNASLFPSGVYFYRLQTESFTQTMRMVLIK